MENNQRTIKKDLLYLYGILYKSKGSSLLDKKVVNRLKYTPKEIEQVLELGNGEISNNGNSKPKRDVTTSQISDIDQLRSFYYSDLKLLYDHPVDEKNKKEILNSVSLDELKRLCAMISSVPISNNTTKMEIVDRMQYYFREESRANALRERI